MSPQKRKIIVGSGFKKDESFKHRRSSLQVNLSYVSNLTDSGNGSLKRTENECNITTAETTTINRTSPENEATRNKPGRNSCKNKEGNINDAPGACNGVHLKDLSVVLERMNVHEHSLNKNLESLKDAILSKTKQLFDTHNEVSVKTVMILGHSNSQNVDAPKDMDRVVKANNSVRGITQSEMPVTPKIANKTGRRYLEGEENNLRGHVDSTPKNRIKAKLSNEPKDKSRIKKTRLFTQNKYINYSCTNHDNISSNTSSTTLPVPRPDDGPNSPILSGCTKRANTRGLSIKTSRKLNVQKRSGNYINSQILICRTRSTSSISSISEDDSIFLAAPIGSSTMIEDELLNIENEHSEATNDDSCQLGNMRTKKTIQSMEITDPRGGFLLTDVENPVQDISSNEIFQNISQRKKMERNSQFISSSEKSVQRSIRTDKSLTLDEKLSDQSTLPSNTIDGGKKDKTEIQVHPIPMEFTAVQGGNTILLEQNSAETINKRTILHMNDNCVQLESGDSIKTTRTSLNVNTSLDGVYKNKQVDENTEGDVCKDKECDRSSEAAGESDMQLAVSGKETESISIARTSLQMNTSLDSLHRLSLRRSNGSNRMSLSKSTESREASDVVVPNKDNVDSMENVSLIERLRNISLPCNRNSNSNSDTTTNKMNATTENQNRKSVNGQSYIEATPYPASKSVLLISQLKRNMVAQNLTANKNTHAYSSVGCDLDNDNCKSRNNRTNCLTTKSRCLEPSTIAKEVNAIHQENQIVRDRVILDESPSQQLCSTAQRETVIIQDSSDEAESENDQNALVVSKGKSVLSTKRAKKKLFPVRENSQLVSFTPMQEERLISTRPTIVKRRRKGKKISTKNKSIKRKDASDKVHVEININEQLALEDDSNTSEVKKKKTMKPRKVISKKIVVKRIVDEDLLRKLESSRVEPGSEPCIASRNSLNDFQDTKRTSVQSQRKRSVKIFIVTTGLSKEDKSLVKSVVKGLGNARIELNVTRRTTHVVSTGVRTINLLHGIIRGCWLVTLEWVLKSLENNKWLNPEEYEMTHFSKAVLENRKDRQLFGPSYVPELFAACGYIHVETGTTPSCDVLKDLIKTAGGRITENVQTAKIIIGKKGLKESWILDSITTGELQSCNQYRRR